MEAIMIAQQVALVTGAGRGIGRGIAHELAHRAVAVVVAELDATTGQAVAEELRALGQTALAVVVDVSQRASVEAAVKRTIDEFGRIDILVNNAGVVDKAPPLEVTEEMWHRIFNVNVLGTLHCSQVVLDEMVAAGRGGAIVNIASQAGKTGSPNALVYSASKAAVINITRSLAIGFAVNQIRVNAVCPGSIDTDMWRRDDLEIGVQQLGLAPGEFMRRRAEQIPLGRFGTPVDVARVVSFLASEQAGYMTGQAINVTGGAFMD
jgi:NAD(P)-dependent dehydrogenase (short-subunit alcohol dehydrogenase family)